MKFEITSWIATELEWKNKCIFTTLTWPWVRGSSHCVVRFLWLTKYTRLSGWTLRSQPKRWFELNYRLKVVKLRRFEFQVKTQDFSYFSTENFPKCQLNGNNFAKERWYNKEKSSGLLTVWQWTEAIIVICNCSTGTSSWLWCLIQEPLISLWHHMRSLVLPSGKVHQTFTVRSLPRCCTCVVIWNRCNVVLKKRAHNSLWIGKSMRRRLHSTFLFLLILTNVINATALISPHFPTRRQWRWLFPVSKRSNIMNPISWR